MVIGSPWGGSGRLALLLGSALVQFMLCSLARGQAFQGSPQGGMPASPLPFPPLPLRVSFNTLQTGIPQLLYLLAVCFLRKLHEHRTLISLN